MTTIHEDKKLQMNIKILTLLLSLTIGFTSVRAQNTPPVAAAGLPARHWTKTIGLGLNYVQNSLTNPPAGYGQNQLGGNAQMNVSLNYDKGKIFWPTFLNWNFGLVRIGSGPLDAGSSQKIPFQKTLDRLQISSLVGYRISRDSAFSVLAGFELQTQGTPSYIDPNGTYRGVFLRDIRNSGSNPILANFFSPAAVLSYVGIAYQPSPKLFIGYSPSTYKGILVLDDAVAGLVGKVDAQGFPTATVHGNKVEIVNGVPVFKNHLSQVGSYLLATYKDQFFKKRLSYSSRLQLFSNYLSHPERVDMYWQNKLDFTLIKGLSLSYQFDLFYDYDVLVLLSDKTIPGGFSGEYGRRVAMQRQLMVRYQVAF